jgi:mevalonate kinase
MTTNGPNIAGVPLREYVEALFREKEKAVEAALEAQAKAVAAALEAADKAVTKAEQNAEKWRENANEWRGAMSDRDRELPSRREVETLIRGLVDKFETLAARLVVAEATLARGSGRQEGIGVSASVLVSVIFAVCAVAGIAIALVVR